MTQIIDFKTVAPWGAEDYGSLKYPWERWLDGEQWGMCPGHWGYGTEKFKKRLRDKARELDMEVEYFGYTLEGDYWILFKFIYPDD